MIVRAGSGWQTVLADLSLILFMVTASALSQSLDAPPPAPPLAPAPAEASATAEPLAVYRPGKGAPSLGEWLALQSVDPRQQLTIVAHYREGAMAAALAQADALAREAGVAGVRPRVVVEPGSDGTSATLAYDIPPPPEKRLAQGLRGSAGHP